MWLKVLLFHRPYNRGKPGRALWEAARWRSDSGREQRGHHAHASWRYCKHHQGVRLPVHTHHRTTARYVRLHFVVVSPEVWESKLMTLGWHWIGNSKQKGNMKLSSKLVRLLWRKFPWRSPNNAFIADDASSTTSTSQRGSMINAMAFPAHSESDLSRRSEYSPFHQTSRQHNDR